MGGGMSAISMLQTVFKAVLLTISCGGGEAGRGQHVSAPTICPLCLLQQVAQNGLCLVLIPWRITAVVIVCNLFVIHMYIFCFVYGFSWPCNGWECRLDEILIVATRLE